mmetsp:Transcript_69223/g.109309  ORF Transcript_69223/g.109309 Transcript_69223/m.109309 type:complete len:86 (+) Transcript_69223:691-948(+)
MKHVCIALASQRCFRMTPCDKRVIHKKHARRANNLTSIFPNSSCNVMASRVLENGCKELARIRIFAKSSAAFTPLVRDQGGRARQ